MPFNCAIQATLSTLTGCSAKIAAANMAPGTRSRTRIRHTNSAEMACTRDVHQMEAEGLKTPDRKLEPIGREGERPVVEVAAGHPDLGQPARLEDRIVQQVNVVVPEESAVPGRLVDQKNRDNQGQRKEPVPRPERLSRWAVFSAD